MSLKNYLNRILLAAIIIVAAFLRFYHFFELPFMWDELSALHRLQFSSFSELIEKGVKPDGHPAGVHVFLYYWVRLFGDAEWVVKLPFNLMGLASIYIFYRITCIWFSEKSGLIAAAFMASLQFFVLYSSIARPYVSGLFLSLMMVYYWSRYMFRIPARKHLIGFILFAALSAYNHHFSLLFAAMVGFTGLLIIKKNQVKEYVLSGILIFALYIPHLPIFFHQLGIGGIGGEGNWLTRPSSNFLAEFMAWAFQYSYASMGIVLALFVFSIFFNNTMKKDKWSKSAILALWFFLPLIIGYYYSTLINPVIQYSVFIFSFPYLIILISSGVGKLKHYMILPLIILIMGLNIFNLIFERQHYQIIFKQPFDLTAKVTKKENENSDNTVFTLYNTIPSYQNYYFKKYDLDSTNSYSIYNKQHTLIEIDQILRSRDQETIIACGLPPEMIPLIQNRFPYFVNRVHAYTMDLYVFSKKPQKSESQYATVLTNHFLNAEEGWDLQSSSIKKDSSGQIYFEYQRAQEWGLNFADSLCQLDIHAGGHIDLIADINTDQPDLSAVWVATFDQRNTDQIWRGKTLELIPGSIKNNYKVYFSLDTQILLKTADWNQQYFKFYIWNKGQDQFHIYDIKIQSRAANPIKYGLFQRLQ